jgi:hypothetical protein
VRGNFGLDGNGENWTGGRLSGDDVRLVKDAAALGCVLNGLGGNVSCVVGGRVRRDLRVGRLADNLVGDEDKGGFVTVERAEVTVLVAGSFTGLAERVEGFELGGDFKDVVRSSPLGDR